MANYSEEDFVVVGFLHQIIEMVKREGWHSPKKLDCFGKRGAPVDARCFLSLRT
jgi:hypothetical protein